MDIKFANPAKYQKLFFQFNPSETRGGINEKLSLFVLIHIKEKLPLIHAQTLQSLFGTISKKLEKKIRI